MAANRGFMGEIVMSTNVFVKSNDIGLQFVIISERFFNCEHMKKNNSLVFGKSDFPVDFCLRKSKVSAVILKLAV